MIRRDKDYYGDSSTILVKCIHKIDFVADALRLKLNAEETDEQIPLDGMQRVLEETAGDLDMLCDDLFPETKPGTSPE